MSSIKARTNVLYQGEDQCPLSAALACTGTQISSSQGTDFWLLKQPHHIFIIDSPTALMLAVFLGSESIIFVHDTLHLKRHIAMTFLSQKITTIPPHHQSDILKL